MAKVQACMHCKHPQRGNLTALISRLQEQVQELQEGTTTMARLNATLRQSMATQVQVHNIKDTYQQEVRRANRLDREIEQAHSIR